MSCDINDNKPDVDVYLYLIYIVFKDYTIEISTYHTLPIPHNQRVVQIKFGESARSNENYLLSLREEVVLCVKNIIY